MRLPHTLVFALLLPMSSIYGFAATRPKASSNQPRKGVKTRIPTLPERIDQTLKSGIAEVMPAVAGKDLGLSADQKLKTYTADESSGTFQVERAFSIAYEDANGSAKPLFLIWSVTKTTGGVGNKSYDIWTFKTDLTGGLQAAAHGGGNDQHVEQSPAPLGDENRRLFAELEAKLVRTSAPRAGKK